MLQIYNVALIHADARTTTRQFYLEPAQAREVDQYIAERVHDALDSSQWHERIVGAFVFDESKGLLKRYSVTGDNVRRRGVRELKARAR